MILVWYDSPIFQITLTLHLNLIFLIFLVTNKVNEDPQERIQQILNEMVIIVTSYFLSGFCGMVIPTADGREIHGYLMLAFTFFNFLFNLVPVIVHALRSSYRLIKNKIRMLKLKKNKVHVLPNPNVPGGGLPSDLGLS